MLRPGRWDFLEGVKAITAVDALVVEMAKVLSDALAAWPPPLEFTDEAAAARFAPVLAEGAARPTLAALTEGLRLAQLEMAREVDAIDHYLRHDHMARACPTPADRLVCELTWKVATEWMWELAERTEGRVKRAKLAELLALTSARLGARAPT